jgi:acyl dehydratase
MTYLIDEGSTFEHVFSFSQGQVQAFAQVTGDTNPVHLDPEYAKQTVFRRPVMHGMLGAGVFSKVLGTLFPGEGSIYLRQELRFLAPMYAGEEYAARLAVLSVDAGRTKAVVQTQIVHLASGKTTTDGQAEVMHRHKFKETSPA